MKLRHQSQVEMNLWHQGQGHQSPSKNHDPGLTNLNIVQARQPLLSFLDNLLVDQRRKIMRIRPSDTRAWIQDLGDVPKCRQLPGSIKSMARLEVGKGMSAEQQLNQSRPKTTPSICSLKMCIVMLEVKEPVDVRIVKVMNGRDSELDRK